MEKERKKRSGCRIVLIVIVAIILVAAAAVFIWFKVNEDKIKEAMTTRTVGIAVGEEAPDLEVTTTDGQTVKLSELREGKDALAVVLFATWCGPCEREFPEMDKVYQKYQDKFAMIGLDTDSLDSDDAAKEYAESHGLSFPVAYVADRPDEFTSSAYPTTMIIDRNGKVGFCRVGAIQSAETFENIVTTFMGDDYQEKQLAYYTVAAYDSKKKAYVPNVEFTVTSEDGTETYNTGESGPVEIFRDKPEDMQIKVISVPDGYQIADNGETSTGLISTYVALPVNRK